MGDQVQLHRYTASINIKDWGNLKLTKTKETPWYWLPG